MAEKRLRLVLNPQPQEVLSIGQVASIIGSVEVANIKEGGTVTVAVDSRCLGLISQETIVLPPGSYIKNFEWSVGVLAPSRSLPNGVAAVTVTARADDLTQAAQLFLRVS